MRTTERTHEEPGKFIEPMGKGERGKVPTKHKRYKQKTKRENRLKRAQEQLAQVQSLLKRGSSSQEKHRELQELEEKLKKQIQYLESFGQK